MIRTALNTPGQQALLCDESVVRVLLRSVNTRLTWDNVHISEAEIAADDAHVIVEKELERVSKKECDRDTD